MEIVNQRKTNLNLIAIAVIAVAIVFVILWFHGCDNKVPASLKITTKEVKGKFESVKPEQEVIHDTIEVPKYITVEDKKRISDLISENKALQEMYNQASDSVKSKMFDKAFELKSFSHTFDDEYLTATTLGILQGDIKSIDLKYTLKPQKIELPTIKETYLRVLTGGGVGLNKELNQFTYKLNLGFQNRKGNTLFGSYQQIGSKKYFTIDYNISIINLKR